jgi:hypothetical protein
MRIHRVILGGLLAVLLVQAGGCGAFVAWTVAQFAPPKKVPAEYKWPDHKRVLVLVEDPTGQLEYEPIKGELTARLNAQLLANGVTKAVVDYNQLIDLKNRMPQFDQLAQSQVAQAAGADLVLYVRIDEFHLHNDPTSPIWQGKFKTSVCVTDVHTGRLWPKDRPAGFPIGPIETPLTAESDLSYGVKLARLLSDEMADRIARCFYSYEVPQGAESSVETEQQ